MLRTFLASDFHGDSFFDRLYWPGMIDPVFPDLFQFTNEKFLPSDPRPVRPQTVFANSDLGRVYDLYWALKVIQFLKVSISILSEVNLRPSHKSPAAVVHSLLSFFENAYIIPIVLNSRSNFSP